MRIYPPTCFRSFEAIPLQSFTLFAMKFTQLAAFSSFFAAAFAQNVFILSPTEGETVAAGSTITVSVQQPVRVNLIFYPW